MLHLKKQATKTLSHIPLRLKASRFRSVISLRESSTSVGGRTRLPPLRMTYRGFIQLFSLATAGYRGAIPYRKILLFFVNRHYKKYKIYRRAGLAPAAFINKPFPRRHRPVKNKMLCLAKKVFYKHKNRTANVCLRCGYYFHYFNSLGVLGRSNTSLLNFLRFVEFSLNK